MFDLSEFVRPKPFVKWVGGKRRLLKSIIPIFNNIDWKNHRYIEPFVGGGAVFMNLRIKEAIISDYNSDLMNAYNVIKDTNMLNKLTKLLDKKYVDKFEESKDKNGKIAYRPIESFYLELRKTTCKDPVDAAARFIYLNKACFNGMYRVNSNNEFNVPMGKFSAIPKLYDKTNLVACNSFFENITFRSCDYLDFMKNDKIKKNDVVYLDPPYQPVSKTSSFTNYTDKDFINKDQQKLLEFCDYIDSKGAIFVQSNSKVDFIEELYRSYKQFRVDLNRSMGGKDTVRKKVKELIITNIKK